MPTAWGLPLVGLCLLLALTGLPAVPSQAVPHADAAWADVIPAAPALPGKPALRAAEIRDATLRRALGRFGADQGPGLQPDFDGPHALAAFGPEVRCAKRICPAGPVFRGETARSPASIGFQTRAPPVAA